MGNFVAFDSATKKVSLGLVGFTLVYTYLTNFPIYSNKTATENYSSQILRHVSRFGLLWTSSYIFNKNLIYKNKKSLFSDNKLNIGITISSSLIDVLWTIHSMRSRKHATVPTINSTYQYYWGHLLWFMKVYDNKYFDLMVNVIDKEFGKNNWPRCVSTTRIQPNLTTLKTHSITLFCPNLIKYCFETKFENFNKGELFEIPFKELLGNGIFSSDPPEWKWHRKIASRMFSMRNLKTYLFNISVNYSDIVINKCKELKIIDINELSGKYTLDCFVNSAFGIDIKAIESMPKIHPFCSSFDKIQVLIMERYLYPWWRIQKRFKYILRNEREISLAKHTKIINDFVYNVINERKNNPKFNLKDESNESCDLLSLFLKHKELNDKQIRDVSMNFILAARDTTKILLSWFFFEISQRPKIEEKIINDIYQSEKNNKFNYETIQKEYKYLEAVLLETLRLHPPVTNLVRNCIKDTKLPGPEGYIIKKGQNVIVLSYTYFRNIKIWGKNAREFNPDKFIEKGLNTYSPYKYPIFNIAPRLCLGKQVAIMEAKIFIVKFLKAFKLKALPNQNVTYVNTALLNMKGGFKIQVFPRIVE